MKIKNLLIIVAVCIHHIVVAQCPNVVWSDEFSGSSLDLTKWNYQIGDGCAEGICGWGNNELQSYQEANVTVANGLLSITAKKERVKGSQYTSGRINTKSKGDFTYGRFEARIKLPDAHGLWPAFWMLPTDEVYGGWPMSGEIDIMEFTSSDPDNVYGTIHYGDAYPNNQHQGNRFYLYEGLFTDDFHEFAIEWEPGIIRWYVDGQLYSTKTSADVAPYQWPFDQNFHFLLNVAVGGTLGGEVNNGMLPSTMLVDYVRVFDGFRSSIEGPSVVDHQASGVTFELHNVSNSATINWSVPSDAVIVSGQGTSSLTVDFGSGSGYVTAAVDNGCGPELLKVGVEVDPPYSYNFSFENFDEPGSASLSTSTGTLTEEPNPAPDALNGSAQVGKYIRNSAEQYDVLVYSTSAISDADSYSTKVDKFYMDVYTNAPVGTPILIQLETSVATSSNYPSGRHSRYHAETTQSGGWERLKFRLLDQPDPSADNLDVSTIIVLFNSNTYTGDTYYFDNLDSYTSGNPGGGTGGGSATAVSVNGIVLGTASAGKGAKHATAEVTVLDDTGAPAVGASVTGSFSGSFVESMTATSDSQGIAYFQTAGSAKGSLTVDFCVDDVVASLPYDASANTVTCTSGSLRTSQTQSSAELGIEVYPNPVRDVLTIRAGEASSIQIINLSGRVMYESKKIPSFIDVQNWPRGVYLVNFKTHQGKCNFKVIK
ncbi:family 16 glycosylhydrolase [Marinoscillum furvescens]|uniref:Putative secreted protein (Por secretion system target) n=1 Tax=Marinoscillum furvescens DSM 4134 TaxID=1122208 RepID=A0A3D9KZ68_MARFU|nr:family 16 glycosylhydrolase [Marinoscillum furvescens]RED93406.1 putative secreted protein (Por secretion system target) [Marinoscillum furvescens DSM 4134]